MQKSGDPRDVSLAQRVARGALVGRRARVSASNDPTLVGLVGDVVDETMNTFTIQSSAGRRVVAKPGQQFAFRADGREVLLDGRDIAHRPEDRVKKASVQR